MSKSKPEVGDIWEISDPNAGTYRALVINTTNFKHPYCITDDLEGCFLWGYSTETYIGESKGSISALFEVKMINIIKVGQIYELPETKGRVVVIRAPETKSPLDWVYFIFDNGYTERLWQKTVKELKLITEYPTWQEAVNSKEFKK